MVLTLSGPASHSSAQAVITQTLRDAVPERALQIAADVGPRCSGCASGVVGAVDRWLSGPASHSRAQAGSRDGRPRTQKYPSNTLLMKTPLSEKIISVIPWVKYTFLKQQFCPIVTCLRAFPLDNAIELLLISRPV